MTKLIRIFVFFGIAAAPAIALAADQAGTAAAVSGRTEVGRGGQWRPLWSGDPVYVGDQLRTGADGRIQVKFVDLTVINVSSNSRLEITEYLYQKESERKSLLRLLRGKLRAVVSKYSGAGRNEFRFFTPTAVAGVRGTDLVLDIQPADPENPPSEQPSENPEGYTTALAVLEGEVALRSILESISDEVFVSGGNLSRVSHGNGPEQSRPMSDAEKSLYRTASFAPRNQGPQFATGAGNSGSPGEPAGEPENGGASPEDSAEGQRDDGGEETGGGNPEPESFTPPMPPINEQPGTVEGLVPVTVEIRRVD